MGAMAYGGIQASFGYGPQQGTTAPVAEEEEVPAINSGRQDKHIPGTNNYRPGRSTLTAAPERTAAKAGTGINAIKLFAYQIKDVPDGAGFEDAGFCTSRRTISRQSRIHSSGRPRSAYNTRLQPCRIARQRAGADVLPLHNCRA